jgi:hypothetical protein
MGLCHLSSKTAVVVVLVGVFVQAVLGVLTQVVLALVPDRPALVPDLRPLVVPAAAEKTASEKTPAAAAAAAAHGCDGGASHAAQGWTGGPEECLEAKTAREGMGGCVSSGHSDEQGRWRIFQQTRVGALALCSAGTATRGSLGSSGPGLQSDQITCRYRYDGAEFQNTVVIWLSKQVKVIDAVFCGRNGLRLLDLLAMATHRPADQPPGISSDSMPITSLSACAATV